MKKIFIIGVTGENSSGKGSISEFIKNNFPDYNPIICNTREKILEIAEQEGVSPTSLYMKLHRLRQILLECIERRLATGGAP